MNRWRVSTLAGSLRYPSLSSLPSPKPPATNNVCALSLVLPFPKCHMAGMPPVAFSDGLLSPWLPPGLTVGKAISPAVWPQHTCALLSIRPFGCLSPKQDPLFPSCCFRTKCSILHRRESCSPLLCFERINSKVYVYVYVWENLLLLVYRSMCFDKCINIRNHNCNQDTSGLTFKQMLFVQWYLIYSSFYFFYSL